MSPCQNANNVAVYVRLQVLISVGLREMSIEGLEVLLRITRDNAISHCVRASWLTMLHEAFQASHHGVERRVVETRLNLLLLQGVGCLICISCSNVNLVSGNVDHHAA